MDEMAKVQKVAHKRILDKQTGTNKLHSKQKQ